MGVFERMTDVRCSAGGKAVSVTLSVLLAFSFLNLSVLPQRAVADEADDARVLAVSDKPVDNLQDAVDETAAGDDAAAIDVTEGENGVAEGDGASGEGDEASGSPSGVENGATSEVEGSGGLPQEGQGSEDAEQPVVPQGPGAADEGSSVDAPTEGVSPAATTLQGEANDGTRMAVTTSAPAGFPAGAQLRVETALSQEVTAALEASLEPGARLGAHTAYKIEVLAADGSLLANAGELTVSVENPPIAPLGASVFRLVGNGNAQQVQGAL